MLMRGALAWMRASAVVDVHVELREDEVSVSTGDRSRLLLNLAIGAGTRLGVTKAAGHDRPVLTIATDAGGEQLTLAASSAEKRDRWVETLEACILKAQLAARAAPPSTPTSGAAEQAVRGHRGIPTPLDLCHGDAFHPPPRPHVQRVSVDI